MWRGDPEAGEYAEASRVKSKADALVWQEGGGSLIPIPPQPTARRRSRRRLPMTLVSVLPLTSISRRRCPTNRIKHVYNHVYDHVYNHVYDHVYNHV